MNQHQINWMDRGIIEILSSLENRLDLRTDKEQAYDTLFSLVANDVSDKDVEFVEDEVGMGCGAWDTVPAEELVAACVRVMARKLLHTT